MNLCLQRCGHLSLLPPLKSWKPRASLSFWIVLMWIVTLLGHISPMLLHDFTGFLPTHCTGLSVGRGSCELGVRDRARVP